MRQIILASNSPQRRKLLAQLGLKFKVAKSALKEKRKLNGPCSRLVQANALNKAKTVAKRYKTGIIIGADTVVAQDKKIWGKPKSLIEAKAMLRKLTQKPQWVYTGLAIIDLDHKKIITDYEKTKIFMPKLSDDEIRRYFSRVSPLDKAGSFDIQGLGGLLINRIEGCFYNVVGLPLAKLYQMLKKVGIDVL